MDKQKMLQTLVERDDDYRRHRPITAEMDIAIFRAYCSGKSAVQISMTIPCSESTVYRAIRRILDFIRTPNVTDFMDALRQHLAAYKPCYGDGDSRSALEMLYSAYCEYNRFERPDTKEGFAKLYEALSGFPLVTIDRVIDEVCALCHHHERDGFTEGLKLGVKLGDELAG